MRLEKLRALLCCLLALLSASALAGQNLRVDVHLRQIVVTVSDSQGQYVPDLRSEDFIVEADGIPQSVLHFASGDTPVTLGLLIDASGSMWFSGPIALRAAEGFAREMKPGDEAFLMTFVDRVALVQDFTQDPISIVRALHLIPFPCGGEEILPAVKKAAEKAKQGANRRRALLLISDGGTGQSPLNLKKLGNQVRGPEMPIYTLRVYSQDHSLFPPQPCRFFEYGETVSQRQAARDASVEERRKLQPENMSPKESAKFKVDMAAMTARSKDAMEAIAGESGGRAFSLNAEATGDDVTRRISDIVSQVSAELRGQYVLGFYPSARYDPERIRVRMSNPAYHVRTLHP